MQRTRVRRLAALVGAATLLLAVAVGPAFAAPGFGDRPGYGSGDSNHNHDDGPPALSEENDWPGWHNGDPNHDTEDGPPGLNLG